MMRLAIWSFLQQAFSSDFPGPAELFYEQYFFFRIDLLPKK